MLPGPERSPAVRQEERLLEAADPREGQVIGLTHDGQCYIHAVATERHFVDHLAPIWQALPPELRGTFFTGGSPATPRIAYDRALDHHGIAETKAGLPTRRRHNGLGLVCASGDLNRMTGANSKLRAVMFEHGCGLAYNRKQNSYAGATHRPNVDLFIFPNELSASRQRVAHPDRRIEVIGSSPRLDPWVTKEYPRGERPVVALSWHFDCMVVAETRTALYYYRKHLGPLLEQGWEIIGHAHPRIIDHAKVIYDSYGIETVLDFEEVMARADLYAIDNSSTLYEFAATGRPVVAINCPRYRRNVSHGLRFWDDIPGLQCDGPEDLVPTIRRALDDPKEAQQLRQAAMKTVYPQLDGRATERAVDLVLDQFALTSQDFEVPLAQRPEVEFVVKVGGETLETDRPLVVRREAQALAAKCGGVVEMVTNA